MDKNLIYLVFASLVALSVCPPGGSPPSGSPPNEPPETPIDQNSAEYGQIIYDYVDSSTTEGKDAILDMSDRKQSEVAKFITTGLHKTFGVIVVGEEKVEGDEHAKINGLLGAPRLALYNDNVRLWLKLNTETVRKPNNVTDDVHKNKLIKLLKYLAKDEDVLIEGFVLGTELKSDERNKFADLFRYVCKGLPAMRSTLYNPKKMDKCPMIVQQYTDAPNEAAFSQAAKLVHTGRYWNPFYAAAVKKAVDPSGNIGILGGLYEGFDQANWADHFVVNPITAEQYKKDAAEHMIALAFTLAWTYGLPWLNGYSALPQNSETWKMLQKILEFREIALDRPVNHIVNQKDVLAFARDQRGYFIANKGDKPVKLENLQTRLPGHTKGLEYVDLLTKGSPTAHKIKVDKEGKVKEITVPAKTVLLFAVGMSEQVKEKYDHTKIPKNNNDWSETEILVHAPTHPGEYIVLSGDKTENKTVCERNSPDDVCGIPIIHLTQHTSSVCMYKQYNHSKVNNNELEWHTSEEDQGRRGLYRHKEEQGVPMIWTTNDKKNPLVNKANEQSPDGTVKTYWYVKLLMKCTSGTIVYIKAKANASFSHDNGNWEAGKNHQIKCGMRNIIYWEHKLNGKDAADKILPISTTETMIENQKEIEKGNVRATILFLEKFAN